MFTTLVALSTLTAEMLPSACARELGATSVASRMSDLPTEIREDLAAASKNEMADSDAAILRTDAPVEADEGLATSRFIGALLIGDKWYVSYEVAMMTPTTIGFVRRQGGTFRRSPFHQFGGPPCEAIRAATRGVTSRGAL